MYVQYINGRIVGSHFSFFTTTSITFHGYNYHHRRNLQGGLEHPPIIKTDHCNPAQKPEPAEKGTNCCTKFHQNAENEVFDVQNFNFAQKWRFQPPQMLNPKFYP